MITDLEFENYYTTCNTRLMNYMRRTFRYDVEDLVSETWLRAWRFRAAYRGDAAFFTWLRSIALNVVREQLRRKRLQQAGFELVGMEVAGDLASGENLAARVVSKVSVDRVFGKCTQKEEDLLVMRFVYGFTFDEIGRATVVNRQTLKSRLRRIRERAT